MSLVVTKRPMPSRTSMVTLRLWPSSKRIVVTPAAGLGMFCSRRMPWLASKSSTASRSLVIKRTAGVAVWLVNHTKLPSPAWLKRPVLLSESLLSWACTVNSVADSYSLMTLAK